MKNRIFTLLLLILLIFNLVGCAKCISTEYKDVEVTIVDEYHRGVWLQPMIVGKVTTIVTHPAKWEITVEYNGVEYTINGSDIYDKYKDKIGQKTIGKLEIRSYDDGTIKNYIVSLE